MPKFAANLTMLFNEVPFLDRFAEAADTGFSGVEFLFPYEYKIDDLRRRLNDHRLALALHNLPPGNWSAGERGIACLPDRVEEFRAGIPRGIEYATALGCKQLNCLAGIPRATDDPAAVRRTLIDNLRFAAEALNRAGLTLLVEAINTRDVPGFYLNTSRQTLALMNEVGAPNLKFQYDIYHMQVMEGNLAPTIQANLERIAHLQLADNPGRNEPGTGEINYGFLFGFLDRIGYTGWIGCEYKPKTDTRAGLNWRSKI